MAQFVITTYDGKGMLDKKMEVCGVISSKP